LFSLLLGVFVGVSVVGLVRFARIGHRPTIVFAAVWAASFAGVGLHYCGYLTTYYGSRSLSGTHTANGQDLSPLIRKMTPSFGKYMNDQANRGRPLFGDYLAQGDAAWLSWGIDALLVIVGAVAVTIPAMRVPFCNCCGTWYRTVRNGKLDQPTARRLVELIGVEEIGHPRTSRFRLSACQGGCGPTRCELSWEDESGAVSLVRIWLDASNRNRVVEILDGLEGDQTSEKEFS